MCIRDRHMTVYAVPIDEKGGKPRQFNVADGKNEDGTPRRKIITKMMGAERWLSAKAFVGSRKQLSDLQTQFNEEVASTYGLARGIKGSKVTHTTVKSWYGQLPQMPARMESATYEELMEFGRAAYTVSQRQKELIAAEQAKAEQARKSAQQALDALREQAAATTGAHEAQLQAAADTIDGQMQQIQSLQQQYRSLRQWIAGVLQRVWLALSDPAGVLAARLELETATRELRVDLDLPHVPAMRVDLRELADGTCRASVIDSDERETWSELHPDEHSAQRAAEAWIHDQQTAPGM